MKSLDLIFCYEEQQLNASTRELDGLIDEAASFDRPKDGRVIVVPEAGDSAIVMSARQRKMRGGKRLIDLCYAFSGMTPLRDTPPAPYFGSTPCRGA